MPAAQTGAELRFITDREWAKLLALLETIPPELAVASRGDDPSPRDILTHRAHWIGLFFQWLDEGEAAQMPDHGVKWNGLKSYNAGLREAYRDVSWSEAKARLTRAHERLRDWIAGADDAALYGEPMPGGSGWTRGRYAEAAGSSHYRSAAKYLRGVLKQAA